MAAAWLLACSSLQGQANGQATSAQRGDVPVTSVTSESWLEHIHRAFNDTSMGKTGHLGPNAPAPGEETSAWQLKLSPASATRTVILNGSDLYRLNCQGCHGQSGLGVPPEINSIIDPVRATSITLVLQRMRATGLDMSRAGAAELARQSQTALLQRLHTGGQDMPAFGYLSPAEIRSLIAYLKQLAAVPGATGEQLEVRESFVRVGEQIVKSTCHVCHSADGPNPSPKQLEDGAIPPLGTLTARTTLPELVRKVTVGAPIVMGDPPTYYRGRMPVFDYFSQSEAASVHAYLALYVPPRSETADLVAQNRAAAVDQPVSSRSGAPAPQNTMSDLFEMKEAGERTPFFLMLGAAWFTAHLFAAGLALTLRHFMRLPTQSEHRLEVTEGSRAEREEVHRRVA
jgi:mono/diheme cytochrome c family protein